MIVKFITKTNPPEIPESVRMWINYKKDAKKAILQTANDIIILN